MQQHPWLGGFDAGEAALMAEVGLRPCGTVVGNAFFLPLLPGAPANSAEISSISKLATEGWGHTMDRLRAAAEALGADGVVDIRLSRREISMESSHGTEFSMIGTAVTGLRQRTLWTTDARLGDVAMMLHAGFAPVALVIGCCTWHESSWNWRRTRRPGLLGIPMWINEEVPFATRALYTARSVAMQRMQAAAMAAGATGVVGVRLETTRATYHQETGGAIAGFEAYGTAVIPYHSDRLPEVTPAIPMS